MRPIETEHYAFNLEHWIMHQKGPVDDVPAGTVRVTMLPGRAFNLVDNEARDYLDQFAEAVSGYEPERVIHPTPVPIAPSAASPGGRGKAQPSPGRSGG